MAQSDGRDEIYSKLISIFGCKVESLTRILFYIDQEDIHYKDNTNVMPPALRILKMSLNNETVFKSYADRLDEDTKRAEIDVEFRKTMSKVYEQMMIPSENLLPDDLSQEWDVARLTDTNVTTTSGFIGLARAWGMIPVSTQTEILDMIPRVISNRNVVASLDEFASLINKTGGAVVMVSLAAIFLCKDAIINLTRWWKGEISGKRCAKNIVDSSFTIGAGIGFGVGGAAVGTLIFGPVGTLIGGISGGIAGSAVVSLLIDKLTQYIFGIPKNEAIENAYNFIGVKMTASNNEINSNFRKLCLEHHPDKGGDNEKFLLVQIHMGVIKLSRKDLF